MKKEILIKEMKNIMKGTGKMMKDLGEVPPVAFILLQNDKGELAQAIFPMLNKNILEHRKEALYALGQQLVKDSKVKHIDGIIFVSEAWVTTFKAKEWDKANRFKLPVPSPSKQSNKKEVIIVTGMTDNGEEHFICHEIKGGKGKRTIEEKSFFSDNKDIGKVKKEELEKGMKGDNYLLQVFWNGVHEYKI